MDTHYTKSKPKVVDFNPITHLPFYNQVVITPSSPNSPTNLSTNLAEKNLDKYARSTSLAGRNIFSNNYKNRLVSNEKNQNNRSFENPRFYKNKPKNIISDPISGETKFYQIQRPGPVDLKFSNFYEQAINEINFDASKKSEPPKVSHKFINYTGSPRKEVPNVPYINPFSLKKLLNN
jgi:hypothetical protein